MPTLRISAPTLERALRAGGRGGHIGFSPVMPSEGTVALEQFHRMKARFEEFGLDYYTSFTMGQRHINNVNLILYNRDDAAMVANARALFRTLVADALERAGQRPARPERHLAARLREVTQRA
jgi:4-cresol dehydrogenase (hydroxylating)